MESVVSRGITCTHPDDPADTQRRYKTCPLRTRLACKPVESTLARIAFILKELGKVKKQYEKALEIDIGRAYVESM